MTADPKPLIVEAVERAKVDPVEITIRSLLEHWGAKRRGFWIVRQINNDLVDAGLTTQPPFTDGWIDNTVRIVPYEPSEGAEGGVETVQAVADEAAPDLQTMLRVGSLPSANTGISFVAPDASLVLAESLMLRDDYSQLAVLSGERNLRGAISWESIAQARIRNPDARLQDAIAPAEPVDLEQDLLALIPRVVDEGFLFVRASDRRICGIVTMADLSLEFSNLATPFFLLGEIERRLRRRIDECFDRSTLEAFRATDETDREIHGAQDLTFGEYGRLLEEPGRWERLRWSVDRPTFIAALNAVREVRNEVMHFSPDPLDAEQVTALQNFIKWLRTLDPRP